jgi:NAD(P)-dependent dehydrogenase (short-subunit alcohol dehydrogenase family)
MEHVVLITGCSSGIGRATARAFLAEEWTVVATARDTDDIADLAERGCETKPLDVTKPAQCQNVVDAIVEEHGRLDCLVNNAGFAQFGVVEDVTTRRVNRQFDVNVYGPHRLVRAALPHMRERENGTIVNVSSGAGRISIPGMGVYSASKFALEALTDALRGEVAAMGIDAVLVEPGAVETQFLERAETELEPLDSTGAYDHIYSVFEDYATLDGVFASDPEEVAAVVVNAASATQPRARYTVGLGGRLAHLARFLPDGLRDWIVRFLVRLA